jgi:hypothetical protein
MRHNFLEPGSREEYHPVFGLGTIGLRLLKGETVGKCEAIPSKKDWKEPLTGLYFGRPGCARKIGTNLS